MRPFSHAIESTKARGLALVELIVVLLILALLAGTAITATEGLVEETYYDKTRATLENVESAILGPYAPPTAHDDTLLAGFVADVGRLPRLDGTTEAELLKELWQKPPTVELFSWYPPPGDPELRIPTGWRGPYLHLGFGAASLVDGWGRALLVLKDDGTTAGVGDMPGRIESLGADGAEGGTDYDYVTPLEIASTVGLSRHRASFRVRVEPALEGVSATEVLVRVYAPVDGPVRVRAIAQHHFQVATDTSFVFADVTVGPRVVRAYHLPAGASEPGFEDATTLSPRSAPITVRLVSGGVPEVVLKVGAPVPPDGR
ncbi:MAG: hypothetical protein ACKVWV_13460 [Planctomycetota bacterium]